MYMAQTSTSPAQQGLSTVCHCAMRKGGCAHLLKSFSRRPCLFCRSLHSSMASCRNSAICSKSGSLSPLDVMAGAPMRTPPGVMADTSPTTAFLLRVMWHRSQHLSILLPVIFCRADQSFSHLHLLSLRLIREVNTQWLESRTEHSTHRLWRSGGNGQHVTCKRQSTTG